MLIFTVALLLMRKRSFFSKQLGIWKLLKIPICSLVQLIPNCLEKKDRFPIQIGSSFSADQFKFTDSKLPGVNACHTVRAI